MLKKIAYYTGAGFSGIIVLPVLGVLAVTFPLVGVALIGYIVLHIFGAIPVYPLVSGMVLSYPAQVVLAFLVVAVLMAGGFAYCRGLQKYRNMVVAHRPQ